MALPEPPEGRAPSSFTVVHRTVRTAWVAAVIWVGMLLCLETLITGRFPLWLKTAANSPAFMYLACIVLATLCWRLGPYLQGIVLASKPATNLQRPAVCKITTSDNGTAACQAGALHRMVTCQATLDAALDDYSTATGLLVGCCTPSSRRAAADPRVTLDDALEHSSEQHTVSASAPALRRLKRLSLKTPTQAYSDVPTNAGCKLVLYIDSSHIGQAVMSALLGSEPGFKLATADTGRQALDMLFAAEWLPDIILIDVMLPDTKPSDVCQALRAVYSPVELPVLLLSSRSGEADMLSALEGGQVNDFLLKPLRRSELMARINSQLMIKASVKREAESRSHYDLLVQVLPPHIIQQLAAGQAYIPEQHEQVTVLFSDIVGFTRLSSLWSTAEVVAMLDMLFGAFDDLCDKHGVFKVETIGDAYMAVAGHDGSRDHSLRMAAMAVDMLSAAEGIQQQLTAQGKEGHKVQIRVGMHTGPAHSGVVGKRRPRYCFFGDTVNTASRMESSGYPMTVHLSEACRTGMVTAAAAAAAAAPQEQAAHYAAVAPGIHGPAASSITGPGGGGDGGDVDVSGGVLPWCLLDMGWRHVKGKGMMKTALMQVGEWRSAVEVHSAWQLQQQHAAQCDYSSTCSTGSPVSPAAAQQQCQEAGSFRDHPLALQSPDVPSERSWCFGPSPIAGP